MPETEPETAPETESETAPAVESTAESAPRAGTQPLGTVLRERFGLSSFRLGQEAILASILAGRDTLAIMPTGGGKSLCFQLPAVAREGMVIVVSPLISLMNDQVAGLRRLGIPAGCIHSGMDDEAKRAVFTDLEAGGGYVLYLSPERVQKAGFARWLRGRPVTLFAIDEAHCISQWGHDFRPDYAALSLLRRERPDVPLVLLTATATPHVVRDISHRVGLREPEVHIHGFYRPNLYLQVIPCRNDAQKDAALRQALERNPEGRVIIYSGTRKACEALAAELAPAFPGTAYYHAGLPAEERTRIQEDYARGRVRILVATNAFGMGIDHPDVRLVVHHQMPANLESYYQEIGRAGRDGDPATCLLLYAKKDKGLQSYFIRESNAPPEVIRHRWESLDIMIHYAEGGGCRHGGILTHFRDAQRIASCGHCDSCAPTDPRALDAAAIAAMERTGRRKRKRGLPSPADGAPLTGPGERNRLEALREWRRGYAREHDMPAFMVFSDKTLRELALRNPGSPDELLAVHGLGEKKADRFGRALLDVLRDCAAS